MNDYSEPDTHLEVQRYYGETLETSDDLKTTACCTAAPPPAHLTRLLADVHEEVLAKYYGCGLFCLSRWKVCECLIWVVVRVGMSIFCPGL